MSMGSTDTPDESSSPQPDTSADDTSTEDDAVLDDVSAAGSPTQVNPQITDS